MGREIINNTSQCGEEKGVDGQSFKYRGKVCQIMI